ncbi:pyridoxamine 5'-phosphate oxidase family protein [Streptomyces sp. NPDC003015]
MTQGPAPRPLSDEALSHLLGKQQFGTLATVKRSGHPHLTTMLYSWDAEARIVRFSTTADRIKIGHLRRDPRASLIPQAARPENVDAFLEQLVAERRVVIRLKVDRLYGTALDING